MLPVASLRLPAKALLARVCSRAVVASVQQSRSYSNKPSGSVRVASSCVHGKSCGVAIPLWSSVPPTSTGGACAVRGLHVSVSVAAKKGKKQKGGKGKNKGGGGGGGGDAGAGEGGVEGLRTEVLDKMHNDMSKAIDSMKRALKKLRAAGASPNMLDSIQVEAYGDVMSLPSVAQVAVRSSNLLHVTVFDQKLADAVGHAILESMEFLNPSVEGNLVKVQIPKLNKETRVAIEKNAKEIAENSRQQVRTVRQHAMKKVGKSKGTLSEDDVFRLEKELEEVVKQYNDKVKDALDAKLKELSK